MVDGIPAYVVKNNHTGKKKVVHRARLLLWLTDYGEPIQCDHVDISDVPPGTVTDRYPEEGVKVATQCQVVVCSTAWT